MAILPLFNISLYCAFVHGFQDISDIIMFEYEYIIIAHNFTNFFANIDTCLLKFIVFFI